jgi:serine/threonine protein kinase
MKQYSAPIIQSGVIPSPNLKDRPSPLLEDHSSILEKLDIKYETGAHYYEIGVPDWIQGWLIDISVIPIQFESLLETILPTLIRENFPFKVARDAGIARAIMDGDLGLILLGKFVTIYTPDGLRAMNLAAQLIELTQHFKGPRILTDRQLRNVVYSRYGACKGLTIINDTGLEEKYIYDLQGNLIKDPYAIPFQLPGGREWPFTSIAPIQPLPIQTILQHRYRPMFLLKDDAKGTVRKGLYLEKSWRIKWCIIKQGKYCMLGDSKGRDMYDRLKWQYELHKELQKILPLPKVYDIFQENLDTYLVMEFIKGRPLHYYVASILRGRSWQQLPLIEKLLIVKISIDLLNIIEQLHSTGYLHRDITSGNFLIDKKQNIWMIDLELAYCIKQNRPQWPFRKGTPGFMSPEQEITAPPSTAQDIYAIGALFIYLFTGLMPEKFTQSDSDTLKDQLAFFIPNNEIVSLILSCLRQDPTQRPSIAYIKEKVTSFQIELNNSPSKYAAIKKPTFSSINKEELKQIIQLGLNGLVSPMFLNEDRLWVSHSAREDSFGYEHNASISVYPEFYEGIIGIIWFLAQANKLPFSLDKCRDEISNNLSFARQKLYQNSMNTPAGLHFGTAGLVMALLESISSGLISSDEKTIQEIRCHLENQNTIGYGIEKGTAGQGMALLKCITIFPDSHLHSLLRQKVNVLLQKQEKDGSWITYSNTPNSALRKCTGFANGVSGIACFLINYLQISKDDSVTLPIIKALRWLIAFAYKKNGHTVWPIHTAIKSYSFDFNEGVTGIVLTMIKAYEVFGDPQYKLLAEDCLMGYPSSPVSADLTQATGLAGIGEAYLEVNKILGTGEWQYRVDWIAQFILHHFRKKSKDACFWMPNGTPFTTAGFMEGNSGILHFLMRNYEPDLISHPFIVMQNKY